MKLGCVETPVATVTVALVGNVPTPVMLDTVVVGAGVVVTLTVPETEGCRYFVVFDKLGEVCVTLVTYACPPLEVELNVRDGLVPTPVICDIVDVVALAFVKDASDTTFMPPEDVVLAVNEPPDTAVTKAEVAVPANVPVKLGCVETPVATETPAFVGKEPTPVI